MDIVKITFVLVCASLLVYLFYVLLKGEKL